MISLSLQYFVNELPLYAVSAIILFLWDLVDLFTELKTIDFFRVRTFWVYYLSRLGFSIAILEATIALAIISITNSLVLAFITPLIFVTLLQNLVVQVGGEKGVNFGDVFANFRQTAIDGLFLRQKGDKAALKSQLLQSGATNVELRTECTLRSIPDEFGALDKTVQAQPDEPSKRIYYASAIVSWSDPQDVKKIIRKYPAPKNSS